MTQKTKRRETTGITEGMIIDHKITFEDWDIDN